MLIGACAVLVLLAGAQLALPAIATHRLRAQLGRYGAVTSVSVHAFPAIELLWHHAGSVDVHLRRYRSGQEPLADFLASTGGVGSLDVRVDELQAGGLVLHDVRLRKQGERLDAQAGVTEAGLRAALPPGLDLRPVGADAGGLLFQGTAGLFGIGASLTLRAAVRDGAVTIAPTGVPFGGVLTVTVFSDPRIEILALGARPRAAGGFTLEAVGRLR